MSFLANGSARVAFTGAQTTCAWSGGGRRAERDEITGGMAPATAPTSSAAVDSCVHFADSRCELVLLQPLEEGRAAEPE